MSAVMYIYRNNDSQYFLSEAPPDEVNPKPGEKCWQIDDVNPQLVGWCNETLQHMVQMSTLLRDLTHSATPVDTGSDHR